MKGTIDASVPNAEKILLGDAKELAEHYTIVDLIRNDLNRVAKKVHVERFRYLEKIETNYGSLLQASSKITGRLPEKYTDQIGDILFSLLPAGSITGAPKEKTVEIIKNTEEYDRGFYTGIFGWFDGSNLESAVMIRFIEQTKGGLVFKSGGGITSKSQEEQEYREMINKVYVPFT
jgi:para-aminobenzoate synthetase component 1